jgi:hypothetical protein
MGQIRAIALVFLGEIFGLRQEPAEMERFFALAASAAPDDPDRDRFLLSKGHGPAAYYAVLAAHGFIPADLLPGFGRYTTNAVLSQAYDRRLPILDGQVQLDLAALITEHERVWHDRLATRSE